MAEAPHLLIVPAFLGAHGGLENHVLATARTAVEAGYRVTVITPRRMPDGEVRPFLEALATVDDVERRWLATPRARAWRAAARAKGVARRSGARDSTTLALDRARPFIERFWDEDGQDLLGAVDLVHAFGKPKPFVRAAIVAAAASGVPVVYTEIAQVTEDYAHRPDLEGFAGVVDRCAEVVVISEGQVAPFRAGFGFAGPVAVIEQWADGLEAELLAIARPRPLDDQVRIGSLCRLSPEKGLDSLVRAFAVVAADHPTAHLALAGAGQLDEDLRALLATLALEERVHVLGFVEDRVGFYRDLDVFAVCSVEEGGPITGAEAMAAGLPLVTTRCGAMPDRVRDGQEGIVVAAEDDDALAGSLARLVDDAEMRRSMGDAARKRYLERNAEAVNAAALTDLWSSLRDRKAQPIS